MLTAVLACSAVFLIHPSTPDLDFPDISEVRPVTASLEAETEYSTRQTLTRILSALRIYTLSYAAQPDLEENRMRVLAAMHRAGLRLDTLASADVTPVQLLARIDGLSDSADITALLRGSGGNDHEEVACRGRVCLALLPNESNASRSDRATSPEAFLQLPAPYQATIDSKKEAAALAVALIAESRSARSGREMPEELREALLEARSDQRFVDTNARLSAQREAYEVMIDNLGRAND